MMDRSELVFERPEHLAATAPAEARGLQRDEVRLLVSNSSGHHHARFLELPDFLRPGDLLVYNTSATLPASLSVSGKAGNFRLNLSTHYGGNLWLAEPRWSHSQPGPLPLEPGDRIRAVDVEAVLVAPYPGLPRLWFVQFDRNLCSVLGRMGEPIRYAYIQDPPNLDDYQTIFSRIPGSAEMPSAARPFTRRVLRGLKKRGVKTAPVLLHTGVSSLEVEVDQVEEHPLYPEPFKVPASTARLANQTRQAGSRVIAVGTTVVRALETAWDTGQVRPAAGFTRRYVHGKNGVRAIDGLLTGLHDPVTSHLAMLYAIAGQERIREAYNEAVREKYRWHEFGDSHLILKSSSGSRS